ncbi:MAG TPA: hypothetical protein VGL94_22555 [Ktedonobacteraceae bacterium]|jgi:hypothetical protein
MEARPLSKKKVEWGEVPSQKSGADPLVNPEQKGHDKSVSANFPQNTEMIQREKTLNGKLGLWRA